MRLKEIGLCVQKLITTLNQIVNIIERRGGGKNNHLMSTHAWLVVNLRMSTRKHAHNSLTISNMVADIIGKVPI